MNARSPLIVSCLLLGLGACGDDSHDDHHDARGGAGGGDAAMDTTGGVDGAGSTDAAPGTDAPAEATADGPAATPHTLFMTYTDFTMNSYDIATGTERAGAVTNVKGSTDMQAIADGHLLVNLTDNHEILVVNGATMAEVRRVPSSTMGGKRPVHSFITPTIGGKTYWVANNDGDPGMLATNTIRFVDLTPASATYLQAAGELPLAGAGHHKNSFSDAKARIAISNIADCNVVLQVVDYTSVAAPTIVKTFSAMDVDPAIDCATKGAGPHGSAYSPVAKRGYHNFTGWGHIVSVAQDEAVPTVKVLATNGSGAGYTKAGKDGRYVYSLQKQPREGHATQPGVNCQIGQVVVIDGMTDAIVKQVPLLYKGPGCTETIAGTPAANVGPDHIALSKDGKTLYVTAQGSPPAGSTEVHYGNQELVLDLADPANPVQKPSLAIGRHAGHRRDLVTGDGKWLFVVNGLDNTVSKIEIATGAATTLTVKGTPRQLASWGTSEGPGLQTGPH